MIIGAYLGAIILANLTVVWWGPGWSIANAFLLIGFDLTARDRLHEAWRGRGLIWRMGLLIATGGLISYLINAEAGRIALASTVAFAAAATADGVTYHIIRRRQIWPGQLGTTLDRVNKSNAVGAAVDSIIFPTLAFGGFAPWLTIGQFLAKVLGGFVWSLILWRHRDHPGT